MSLDVYLTSPGTKTVRPAAIFVREGGATRTISREEWDARFPGTEPVTVAESESEEVYSANITHNLNRMAGEAGIYEPLWRPDEIGITTAKQLIEPLEKGLALLKSDPERFRKHDAQNKWGTYDQFVPFVERYLEACREYPDALVRVSR